MSEREGDPQKKLISYARATAIIGALEVTEVALLAWRDIRLDASKSFATQFLSTLIALKYVIGVSVPVFGWLAVRLAKSLRRIEQKIRTK